jgi:hypothetical protein
MRAFESAKSSVLAKYNKENEGCFTCCCAHPHNANCGWFIFIILTLLL